MSQRVEMPDVNDVDVDVDVDVDSVKLDWNRTIANPPHRCLDAQDQMKLTFFHDVPYWKKQKSRQKPSV
jgi:hypothetical protein